MRFQGHESERVEKIDFFPSLTASAFVLIDFALLRWMDDPSDSRGHDISFPSFSSTHECVTSHNPDASHKECEGEQGCHFSQCHNRQTSEKFVCLPSDVLCVESVW